MKLQEAIKSVIVLKNNKPKYVVSKFNETEKGEEQMITIVAKMILTEHINAFKELGK